MNPGAAVKSGSSIGSAPAVAGIKLVASEVMLWPAKGTGKADLISSGHKAIAVKTAITEALGMPRTMGAAIYKGFSKG